MRSLLAVALAAALAAPAVAQGVPDELPDRNEPFADRAQREIVERHRPFLSGLYLESTLAAGPVLGEPVAYGAGVVEGGYRFDGGDAIAVLASFRAPLEVNPLTGDLVDAVGGTVGAQYALNARRFLSESPVARRAELAVGAGVSFVGEDTRGMLELVPRYAIPMTPTLSLPVGLRVSQELGPGARGPFVGLSLSVRRIWADEARMVLQSD